jgi:hypothetical protein
MKAAAATALALSALLLASGSAEAQEKKVKKPKESTYQKQDWGRRLDLTVRYWPVHQHHYVKIR